MAATCPFANETPWLRQTTPPRRSCENGSLAVIQKIDRLFKVPADGKRKGAAVCVVSGYRSGESAVHGRALQVRIMYSKHHF